MCYITRRKCKVMGKSFVDLPLSFASPELLFSLLTKRHVILAVRYYPKF
jgi:hypothetical protein